MRASRWLIVAVVTAASTIWAQGTAEKVVATKELHAVLVTYETDTPPEQMVGPSTAYAKGLKQVPGLILKVWVNEGKTFGGFHVFATKEAAEMYLNSEMFQKSVAKNPNKRNVVLKHFSVSNLSLLTGLSGESFNGK